MGFKGCEVINSTKLPDGPWMWDTQLVAEEIQKHLSKLDQLGIKIN